MKKLYLVIIAAFPFMMSAMDGKKVITKLKQFKKEPVWEMAFGQHPETACWDELQKYDVNPSVVHSFMQAHEDKMDLDFDPMTISHDLLKALTYLKAESQPRYQELVCATVYCAKGLAFLKTNELDVWPINKDNFRMFKDYMETVRMVCGADTTNDDQ